MAVNRERSRELPLLGFPEDYDKKDLLHDVFPVLGRSVQEIDSVVEDLESRGIGIESYSFGLRSGGQISADQDVGRLHEEFFVGQPLDVALRMLDNPESVEGKLQIEDGNYSAILKYSLKEGISLEKVEGPKYGVETSGIREWEHKLDSAVESYR